MGEVTEVIETRNQQHVDYSTAKLFTWDNKYAQGTLKNIEGIETEFVEGTVLGRDSSDNKLVPIEIANNTNGEAFPVGILAETVTIPNAGEAEINMCVSGEVVEDGIVLVADAIDDVLVLKTLRDRIGADTVGIKLRPSTNLTQADNQ